MRPQWAAGVDWSLLSWGGAGHVPHAPAEFEVRKQVSAQTESGEAWRCLRCGTFVPGEPQLSGPAAQAPGVRRGQEIRGALILRVFAVERFVRALIAGALAFGVWRIEYSRVTVEDAFQREFPSLRALFRQLGFNISNSKLLGLIHHPLLPFPLSFKLAISASASNAPIY